MTKIKIIQIKASNPKERANKIEELQNINSTVICRGSIYFEHNGELYADVYFQKGESEIRELSNQQTNKPAGSNSKKEFKPSEKLLQKWSKEPISEKTKNMLIKHHGMTEKELAGKTQLEAHHLIESLKRDRI